MGFRMLPGTLTLHLHKSRFAISVFLTLEICSHTFLQLNSTLSHVIDLRFFPQGFVCS